MLGRISYRELIAIVIGAIVATSCAQNGSTATSASGASSGVNYDGLISGSSSSSTTTTSSSSTGGTTTTAANCTGLTIGAFSPVAGSYATLPTSVQVAFNETNLSSSVSNVSNWVLSCNSCGYTAFATSVTYSGGFATVYLPTLPSSCTSVADNSCMLTAGSGITDTNGNAVSCTNSVTYTLSSSSTTTSALTVTSFSPTTGSSMPSTVTVAFSSTNMNGSAVDSTSNWALSCTNGSSYTVTSVVYNYSGDATVTLPSSLLDLAAGTQCTLTANSGITDMYGDILSSSSVTYTVPSSGTNSTTTGTPTQVGTAGGTGGSPFTDEFAPTGTNLAGLVVGIGSNYVGNVQAEWADSSGDTTAGVLHGNSSNDSNGTFAIYCPDASYGFRASGIYGNLTNGGCGSSGNQPCLQSIGLVCSILSSSTYYSYFGSSYQLESYTEGYFGSSLGSSYELDCPTGTFITELYGNSGNGIDQLGIGCM